MSYLVAFLLLVALGSAAIMALGLTSARRSSTPAAAVANQLGARPVRRQVAHALPKPPPLREDLPPLVAGERSFPPRTRFHIDPRFGEENQG